MAITVVGFDNVQMVDVSPNPASGSLFLITGVAKINFSGSTTPDSDGWTRDTCSFDVPTPLGRPFLFTGAAVRAAALVVPATVQNVGSADIGFGVDHTSVTVSDPINGARKATLTSLVVTRNTQGIIWRLAFQAQVNVLAVAPQPPQVMISDLSNENFSICVPQSELGNPPRVDGGPYSANTIGLLPPVMFQWTGGPGTTIVDQRAESTEIDFTLPNKGLGERSFQISVQATDQLGVSVSTSHPVSVDVVGSKGDCP